MVGLSTTGYRWISNVNETLTGGPTTGYQISDDGITWYDPTSAVQQSPVHIEQVYGTYPGVGANFWQVTPLAAGVVYTGATPPFGQAGMVL